MNTKHLVNALDGKSKAEGGLNLSELRKEIINYFDIKDTPIIQKINRSNREELKKMYSKKLKRASDTISSSRSSSSRSSSSKKSKFRVLVLCANDKTIKEKKSNSVIISLLKKIKKDEIIEFSQIEYHYINGWDEEIKENLASKNKYVKIVDISDLNEDIFKNDFFDVIFDENCPLNNTNVLTKNTMRWVNRILKKDGFLILNNFTGIGERKREFFYRELKLLCTTRNVDELLHYVKLFCELNKQNDFYEHLKKHKGKKDDVNIILYEFLDEYLKQFKELDPENWLIFMDGKKIYDIKHLKKEVGYLFEEIFATYNKKDHHIYFRK